MPTNSDRIYAEITDKILAALDAGTIPWKQPWSTRGSFTLAQRNALTKRPYRGVNVFTLLLAGREDPRWATFKQIKKAGGFVKRGSTGQTVIFWKFILVEDEDDAGKKYQKRIPILKSFKVFNVGDTEGLNLENIVAPVDEDGEEFDPIIEAEAVANNYLLDGPCLSHDGGTRAYYNFTSDEIHLPEKSNFETAEGYYDTLFHEIGHSTGHSSRCDREVGGSFGSHRYGREELVAEFTSAFLSSHAGIDQEVDNQAAYIASWKRTIKADKRAVVVAAGRAQRAADLVLGAGLVEEEIAA